MRYEFGTRKVKPWKHAVLQGFLFPDESGVASSGVDGRDPAYIGLVRSCKNRRRMEGKGFHRKLEIMA